MSTDTAAEDATQLRAQLAAMKSQLEASQLREQLRDLENENLKLRQRENHHKVVDANHKQGAPIIQVPNLNEKDLDEAFETMMMECLTAENKRDSLRSTYYEKTSTTEKYYFFLEWASYLRKPEVMEQNAKTSSQLDVAPPEDDSTGLGDEEGMRQRNAGVQPQSPTNGMEMGYDKHLKPTHSRGYPTTPSTAKQPLTLWVGAQYILLVLTIAGLLFAIKGFLQQKSPVPTTETEWE